MEIKAPSQEFLKTVLCYPSFQAGVFSERLKELAHLDSIALLSEGPMGLSRWRILGKGHVGVVVAAKYRGVEVALKILRTDADRRTMEREGVLLAYANTVGVGPRLIRCSKSFMITEMVSGVPLGRWKGFNGNLDEEELCARNLLFQGFRLDLAGLDHGELSRPDRHILVQSGGTPVILDFESASVSRRCNNLSSLVQYLFIRRADLRDRLTQGGTTIDFERLFVALKVYRANKFLGHYMTILEVLGM